MYEEVRPKGQHFTNDERAMIERMRKKGYTHAAIADCIGCSRSAVTKELKKGRTLQLIGSTYEFVYIYTADTAKRHAEYQKTAHSSGLKIGNNYAYLNALRDYILKGYSPYAAIYKVGNCYGLTISKQTLYRYIKEGLLQGVSYKNLPVGKRKKHHGKVKTIRVSHPEYRSIEKRSKEVCTKSTYGHWEMDSIIGTAEGDRESCLVLTERKTNSEIVIKVQSKTAASTVNALHYLKKQIGRDFCRIFHTITVDNGSEFADQQGIDHVGVTTFYCHPSCPSERGSNENQNKLLRRFFPKGKSMKHKTQMHANQAMRWINDYPREKFHGRSSNDLLLDELKKIELVNPERVYQFFNLVYIE